MEPTLLISLLGKPSVDEEVEAALRWYNIRRRPKVVIDVENMEGPVVEPNDWVINSRAGIEFGFEDEVSFNSYDIIEGELGSMLLTQIYLYGEHDGVDAYQGQLPFGLQMSDDRDTVRTKLVAWESTRRSYMRDVWELPECRLTISYVEEGARIGFILLWSRRNMFPRFESSIAMPGIQEIIETLGKDFRDPVVRNIFQYFPLQQCQEFKTLYNNFNLREDYGFELRFHRELGLIHVIFYREKELESHGWQGLLPCGVEFNDSPEIMLDKMSQQPEMHNDELFIGNALWNYGHYCIRVNYCTMKNYILSVDLLDPKTLEVYSKGI